MRWIPLLIALGACGRWGFSGSHGDGGGADDDDGSEAGTIDALPALPPTLVSAQLAAGAAMDIQGVAFASDGTLAITGGYAGTMTLDGKSVAQVPGSFGDVYTGVFGVDAHVQGLFSAGIDGLGNGRGISRDGTNLAGTGYFSGTETRVENRNSGSGQDILLTVTTEDGTLVKAGNWGSTGNCQGRQIASRGGRIVIAGTYVSSFDFGAGALPDTQGQDNAFIASFPSDLGTPKVRTIVAGGDVFPSAISIGPAGSMCIAGRFSADANFGNGVIHPDASSAFIAKYDIDLNLEWVTALGSDALAGGVAMLADGSCVATGQFDGSFGTLTTTGNYDIWIGRFAAADGATAWLRGYGSTNADTGYAVAAVPGGGILASAIFNGSASTPMGMITPQGATDAFIARFDDNGTPVAQELISGSGDVTIARGLAISDDGSRVALGLGYNGAVSVAGVTATSSGDTASVLFLPMLH